MNPKYVFPPRIRQDVHDEVQEMYKIKKIKNKSQDKGY